MKTKMLNLIILGFICILLYSVFVYAKEGFSEGDAFGQWELLIRQSYNTQFDVSPFDGISKGVFMTATHDYKGDIIVPNYYDPRLLNNYNFGSNYIFKIHSYENYEHIEPKKIFTWSQGFNQNMPTNVVNRTSNFSGLEKGDTTKPFIFKQGPRLFNRIVIRHPKTNERKVINLRELQVWINGENVLTNAGMNSTQTGDLVDCADDTDNQCETETLDTDDTTIQTSEEDGGNLDEKNIEFINWNTKKVLTSWWSGTRYPQGIFKASNIANKNIGGDLNVHSWSVAGVALYIPMTKSYLMDDIQSLVLYNRANSWWRLRLAGFQIELYYNRLDEPIAVLPISETGNRNAYVFKGPKWSTVSDTNKSATNSNDKILGASWAPLMDITLNQPDSYVLGASQTYLDTNKLVGEPDEKVEKMELYLWNPRPKNKNTFNKKFDDLSIQKVSMNNSVHKHVWNKTAGLGGELSDTNPFSYCFGKLRCNDNRYTPVYDIRTKTYKPYCNDDSSNNPVYCEGSILYNTGTTTKKRVPIGSLQFDMMGKYASYDDLSNSHSFNLFRGLTIPTNDTVFDPELINNNVVFYDKDNKKEAVNICEFLDNANLDNGTNIQTECKESLKSTYKSCVANYGESVDSKYFNYICDPNEKCVGYDCGVQFGKCTPAKL